ncbi:hypothetical protein [Streptomyces sp. NPDC049906]|uniref:hypothetical protein n=1 Tax=Streptomyces sp. NPDC049906 TaxID=3155656 RepID=UPI00343D6159
MDIRVAEVTHRFVRDTVTSHGNVVRATHGEPRTEALGSGDAVLGQRFEFYSGPLTYVVAAPDRAGAVKTQPRHSPRTRGRPAAEPRRPIDRKDGGQQTRPMRTLSRRAFPEPELPRRRPASRFHQRRAPARCWY